MQDLHTPAHQDVQRILAKARHNLASAHDVLGTYWARGTSDHEGRLYDSARIAEELLGAVASLELAIGHLNGEVSR